MEKGVGGGESALGYGEILPETVFEVMEVIRKEHGGEHSVEGVGGTIRLCGKWGFCELFI